MSYSALLQQLQDLVPDTGARLTAGARGRALESARKQYSKDRPRLVVEDVIADGSTTLPLPAEWVQTRSALVSIEYPLDLPEPPMLDPEQYLVVRTPTGDAIRLRSVDVRADDPVRLTYSAAHVLVADPDDSTIPDEDAEAVACWAAALLCDQLAASYADNTEPTIQADRTDYTSPHKAWSERAKAYRTRYGQLLGIDGLSASDKPAVKAASAVADMDSTDSRGMGWSNRFRNRPFR